MSKQIKTSNLSLIDVIFTYCRLPYIKIKSTLLLTINLLVVVAINAQDIPFVYDVENTGAEYSAPVLPSIDELPDVHPLTDPFMWSDGSARDTTFENWAHRRAEIKAEIEHYEIGEKPEKPDTINAVMIGDTLMLVTIIENGDTLNLSSTVQLPEGDGPFPAVIAMDFMTIPSEIFTDRNVAIITFTSSQVMQHTQIRGQEPINRLYPDLIYMGAYSAWPWGVSRIIDGLEMVQDSLPVDLSHLAVTGCSYAGKMALFAGALDERIALTIAQESGGGGAAAWRVSQTLSNVETLGATNSSWFILDMFDFQGTNVSKLPLDHHELMTMVAPRALLVLGNPDMEWLADESGYVSCRAAHEVWKKFGIPERFGFSIVGGHGHCQLPTNQYPEVEAFVERFLLGNSTVNTDYTRHPFTNVNYKRWYEWWGTDNPVFPEQIYGFTYTFEPECSSVGSSWQVNIDSTASNNGYTVARPGKTNMSKDDIEDKDLITIPFYVDSTENITFHARIKSPSPDKASFWYKIDDGSYYLKMNITTEGWEWIKLNEFELEEGDHVFSIAFRENGGQFDKLSTSSLMFYKPDALGGDAENICTPEPTSFQQNTISKPNGFNLEQNKPNPMTNFASISFQIPYSTFVSLKVYNVFGKEVTELVGEKVEKGKHSVILNANNLSEGIYFYTLKAGKFTESKKMILNKSHAN